MSEIKHSEKNELKQQNLDRHEHIQPNSNITVSIGKDILNNKLKDQRVGDNREYFDDNKVLYRIGDSLVPDNEYTRKGYQYRTDSKGRIISAEGKLQVKDHEGKNREERVDKTDYKEKDDQGCLIGDRFNGVGDISNIVPMESKLNRGAYNSVERTLKAAVDEGSDVRFRVEPRYSDDSSRPAEFKISYIIDGEKSVVIFRNERGRSDD